MSNLIQNAITREIIINFTTKFTTQLNKEINKLNNYNIGTRDFLPEILSNDFGIDVVFSVVKGHFMIIFTKINIGKVNPIFINGDVIDIFDETGLWSSNRVPVGFNISNSSNIKIKNVQTKGIKPFTLYGNNIEMYIEDMDFYSPTGRKTSIEYAFVFSYSKLVNVINDIEHFTSNFVYVYWDYFGKYREKLDSTSDKYNEYLSKLKKIKYEMDYYFYDEKVLERDIEDFINKNSVIIGKILGLENPIVQAQLSDINQIYGHTLKPDLMGFDSIRNNWTIVDYKLGRRANLVKSPGGVRVKFYDEVAKLEAQLRIYRKYFNENDHRSYFNKKYNTTIQEYPHTIGIIGYVDGESRKDFNELMDEKSRWFDLVPYNDLQARFEKFISMIENIN